jgi:alpha-beta hydrolase superfamily lysophospholipase
METSVKRFLGLLAVIMLLAAPVLAAFVGSSLGDGILHPARLLLTPERMLRINEMLQRTGASEQDFVVRAPDDAELRGWKVHPEKSNGDWVIIFHGIADNRTGDSGHAEFLLRHGYSVVMMDSRAQGESGGDIETYGWKERYDTVAVTDALYASEQVRHLYALGVSLGGAIALQSAAVDQRIEAVAAEAPFANLREVSYDYAGLHAGSWLGKSLFRPASIVALKSVEKDGGFRPEDASPEKAVAERSFPVLLICGTRDATIPCRHSERIYKAATGPKELWIVQGAGHASALGQDPAEYENRVIPFFEKYPGKP